MTKISKKELEETISDQEWWDSAGKVLGLRLYGFTFRQHAAFFDKNDKYVEMTPAIAEALHEINSKFDLLDSYKKWAAKKLGLAV